MAHRVTQGYEGVLPDVAVGSPPYEDTLSRNRSQEPYAQDHPRAELLKHKGFAVMAQPTENVSSSRLLLDWGEGQLRAAAPLMHLIDNALTEPAAR